MENNGYVGLDVAMFMAVIGAVFVQLYYMRSRFKVSISVGMINVLRLAGWSILGARYANVLFTQGDIAISLPAVIGIIFLAAGEIATVMNRGKQVLL